jgi:uncharacterized protein (DUF1330 family)
MPKGYVILTEDIKDQVAMEEYSQKSAPPLIESRARVLAVDTEPQTLEGEWHGNRTVVLEFESVEAAHAWYESESYQKVLPLRLAAADCNVVILSGFERPA